MGLFLAIVIFIMTIPASIFVLHLDAMNSPLGTETPWMTIIVFGGGMSLSAFCALTHFVKW